MPLRPSPQHTVQAQREDGIDLRSLEDGSGQQPHDLVDTYPHLAALLAPDAPLAEALETARLQLTAGVRPLASHPSADIQTSPCICSHLSRSCSFLAQISCSHMPASSLLPGRPCQRG